MGKRGMDGEYQAKEQETIPEPVKLPSVEEFHHLKHQQQLNAIYALLLKLQDE